MAGVPLLNGFLSKEMFFAETAHVGGTEDWTMSYAAVAMGIFSVAYSLRFISVFFGQLAKDLPKEPHEPVRWMRFPVECLVVLCIAVGVMPERVVGDILAVASSSVLGAAMPAYDLAIWHGFNLALGMSGAALVLGALLYWVLLRRHDLRERTRVPVLHRLKGAQAYESTMLALSLGATWIIRLTGTRRLQPQLLVLMSFMIVVPLLLVDPWFSLPPVNLLNIEPLFAVLWLIGAACAAGAAYKAKYHRLAALSMVGGTGIVTAITFVWLSAPDLALTQLMVETVTTVLILLGLRWLPPRLVPKVLKLTKAPPSTWFRRSRDSLIAVGGGLGIAAASYAVLMRSPPPSIGEFFVLRALHRRRRLERRQRAAGRLPRFRHAGRSDRAVGRGADRVCTAAPLPSRHRIDRDSRAAGQRRRSDQGPGAGHAGAQRLPDDPGHLPAPAAAGDGRDGRLLLHARP